MAAIVCSNILQMGTMACSSLVDITGSLGQTTKEGCISFGQASKEHFALFQVFLREMYVGLIQIVLSPFFPYLAVTYVLNIPPFIFGVESLLNEDCHSTWLLANTLLTAMHILTGSYMVVRIRVDDSTMNAVDDTVPNGSKIFLAPTTSADPNAGDESAQYIRTDDNTPMSPTDVEQLKKASESSSPSTLRGAPSSWERIRYVMCYDMVMAVYYVLFLFWVIWQALGTAAILSSEADDSCGKYLVLSIVFGFLYMGLVVVALICSICFLRYRKISEAIIQQQQQQTQETGASAISA